MLKVRSLEVAYGHRTILPEVSLEVQPGETLALIGPNGSGKTTLVRAISGVVPAKRGRVWIGEAEVSNLPAEKRARYLAVVPQAHFLPGLFTVWETVLMGRTPYLGWLGQPSTRDKERVYWALERTQLLPLKERLVGQLSGGEQQRVLLARALAQETRVLLLDEPTSHLDLQHQGLLLNLVRQLAQEECLAVLMVVHDLNLAGMYADRVALLVSGQIQAIGDPVEVLTPQQLGMAYQVPVQVIPHPYYGTPLVLPDGHTLRRERH